MAAGGGTRYGGLKQIEPLGPAEETIVDYSIFDALRAGFRKVVFIIRHDIESAFRAAVGRRIEQKTEVCYVFQDDAGRPEPTNLLDREKPWGTAHAILAAADVVHESFAVVNADDYYGPDSFRILGDHLHSASMDAALVGFILRNTLSDFGGVKRGLCQVLTDGILQNVTELEHIERDGQAAKYTDPNGVVHHLSGDELVSMNMWGFSPTIFDDLRVRWIEFVRNNGTSESAEFYIPSAITDLIQQGRVTCRVLQTSSSWFGMTYREDRSIVATRIRELVSRGVYAQKLWP
jgi:dTDP-glucose pyrophosphorylase